MQLGLSKHNRHVELSSLFGQFQLSKVQVHQDLAAMLTYNPPASGLHWLLPKLRMHIKTVAARALPTVLCEKEAFFLGSPCSFYIGVISLTPMMAQLDLAQLERTAFEQLTLTAYARQLWGKEPEKPTKIPELQLALLTQTSLQRKELAKMTAKSLEKIELERTALHTSFRSLLQTSLRTEELTAEGACHAMAQCFAIKPDEGRRALALHCAALLYRTAFQLQFLGKELVNHLAVPKRDEKLSLTRVSGGASGALAVAFSNSSSTKPPRRTLHSFSSILLSIFLISMVSIFPSNNNNSFIHCCAFQLVEQDELSTTFGQKELGKTKEILELQTLLWELELEELLVDKSFPLDPLHDHLGKENLWSVQLQQNLLENDEQKELDNPELEEKNFHKSFQKMIFLKKLDALLLEWHFAKATSHQLVGIKAWEKYREASKEISFDKKKGDKELPQQLRRQELDCKDLRSASFRALCPTRFEENSFTEETFSNTSLGEETFKESSLTTSNFTRNNLTENSLTRNSLTTSNLTTNNFPKSSLTEHSFLENSFSENTFLENSFSENSFDKRSLEAKTFSTATAKTATSTERPSDWQLRAQQLGGTEFPPSSFELSSLKEETFDNSSFHSTALQKNFAQESFQSTAFKKSFAQKNFHQHSFYKNSFDESSLEDSSFNQRNFEESSFDQSSLEENSLKTSSFEQSNLEPNSFEHSSLEASSFTQSSFQDDSLTTETSLADRRFKRPALPPELSQLKRPTLTTELAQLQPRPFRTELAQLALPALHTELAQLEKPAFRKAAFSLELNTAHFATQGSLASLCGPGSKTIRVQGGVLSSQLPCLTLDQLEFPHLAAQACLELSEKRASPLQA